MKNGKKISNELVGALADAFGKSPLTIRRWFKKKSDMLTTDKAKEILTKFETANK